MHAQDAHYSQCHGEKRLALPLTGPNSLKYNTVAESATPLEPCAEHPGRKLQIWGEAPDWRLPRPAAPLLKAGNRAHNPGNWRDRCPISYGHFRGGTKRKWINLNLAEFTANIWRVNSELSKTLNIRLALKALSWPVDLTLISLSEVCQGGVVSSSAIGEAPAERLGIDQICAMAGAWGKPCGS